MNEMNATVHDVANNSAQAAVAAKEAHTEAERGQAIVHKTISEIGELANEIEAAADVIRSVAKGSEQIGSIFRCHQRGGRANQLTRTQCGY